MGEAIETLTRLVEAKDRYDIPFADLRKQQIAAMNERLQERKDRIKLVSHRAKEAGITEVRSHEEVGQAPVAAHCLQELLPARDKRIFGMAAIAQVPRNLATGEAYTAALQDPNYERFAYPVPPITVGVLTQMVVLRKAIADGTAKPEDIAAFEKISATRQKAVDDAVGITAQAVVDERRRKLHVSGLRAGLYNVAKAVREMGYSAKDFHAENGPAWLKACTSSRS